MMLFFALALLSATPSRAGEEIVFTIGNAKFHNVALGVGANWTSEKSSTLLKPVGHGLRHKKIVFVKVDVYVAELFVANPESFEKKNAEAALASLEKSTVVAMRMTFLRDVEPKALEEAFRSACEGNGLAVEIAPVSQFLSAVKEGGQAKKGGTLVIWGSRHADGKETISYKDSSGTINVVMGEKGFVRQIFSLWLGKTSDSGVESMQKQILGAS